MKTNRIIMFLIVIGLVFTFIGCGDLVLPIPAETPVIDSQPESADYTFEFHLLAVPLTVTATVNDGELSYQWYMNNIESTEGGEPVGEDESSYTPDISALGTLYYYVVVTNSVFGLESVSVTSDIAVVTVSSPNQAPVPDISVHPTGANYIQGFHTEAVPLTVTATVTGGGTLSYEWYRNEVNSTMSGTPVGTDSNSYTPDISALGTLYYYVVITNPGAETELTSTVTSNIAAIEVVAQTPASAPVISVHPVDANYYSVLNPQAASLTVTATGSGTLSYAWYSNSSSSTTGGTPVGNNSSSYTPVITELGTLYYYVVITNSGAESELPTSATSSIAAITVIGPGDGTEDEPFRVFDPESLQQVGKGTGEWSLDAYYELVADIDMTGIDWIPIGNVDTDFNIIPFTGTFNGNNHTISNLTIKDAANPDAGAGYGFIGYIGPDGRVENLILDDLIINGAFGVGGIVGEFHSSDPETVYSVYATIDNCHVSGKISGMSFVGGIAGLFRGTISNSTVKAEIDDDDMFGAAIGGIVGCIEGELSSIVNCEFTGSVRGWGWIGGIAGMHMEGFIDNCTASGELTGEDLVGGVVGQNYTVATVKNSTSLIQSITRSDGAYNNFGRVIGFNEGTLINNKALADMIMPDGITVVSDANGVHGADITE